MSFRKRLRTPKFWLICSFLSMGIAGLVVSHHPIQFCGPLVETTTAIADNRVLPFWYHYLSDLQSSILILKVSFGIALLSSLVSLYLAFRDRAVASWKRRAYFASNAALTLMSSCFLLNIHMFYDLYRCNPAIGRPLRRHGKILLSKTKASREWLLEKKFSRPRHSWLETARGEHSSVSAFAELSLKLAQLGCPPALLSATHQAAIDEINHAQISFTLDAAQNNNTVSHGPAPETGFLGGISHSVQLQKMALDTFSDGCLFEAISTRQLKKLAEEETDPEIKKEIEKMVLEEETHVKLSWDILDWCLKEIKHEKHRSILLRRLNTILEQSEARSANDEEKNTVHEAKTRLSEMAHMTNHA